MSDGSSQAGGNTPAPAGAQPAAGATTAATGAPAAPAAPAAAPAASQQAPAGQTAQPAAAPGAATTGSEPGKDGGEGGKPAQSTAPDKYEFKAPQGITFDADTLGAFSEVAKELGLSQDAAQKVLDKMGPKLAAQSSTELNATMQKVTTEWTTAVKSDQEYGGEKLTENLAVAKRAVERYASPQLRALLNPYDPQKNPKGMGLGNHPEVVRLFFKVGKAISEDGVVQGGRQPSAGENDLATRLYGKPS
jgi:hypothetical protein